MRIVNRLLVGLMIAVCAAADSGFAQQPIPLKVLGQPPAAGAIVEKVERPFFRDLAERTGLPLAVEYVPLGSPEADEAQAFSALQSEKVQVAALRVSEVGRLEPTLLGLDLVGLNRDYVTGRQVVAAYIPALTEHLERTTGVKILGAWPFGPEMLFCNKPITKLADIRSLRVRVYDAASAALVEQAVGIPVRIGFAATRQALSDGTLDCAIGNPVSARAARWPEAATHVLPVAFQLGINAYGMSASVLARLPQGGQAKLIAAFQSLIDEIWRYSEQLSDDALGCMSGKPTCTSTSGSNLTRVPVAPDDIALLRGVLRHSSFPRWAETCDKVDPDCSKRWMTAVGPVTGLP